MISYSSRVLPLRRALLFLCTLFFVLCFQAKAAEDIDFPEGFGKINEVFDADPQRTVVIVQDAHRNYECQLNTIEILNSIEVRKNIPLLALEGAQGGFLTGLLAGLPDRQLTQDIGLYFLREGRITSPEYFSIVNDTAQDTELFGVEDPALYLENLSAFKEAYRLAQELSGPLAQVKEAVRQLKTRIYSGRLNDLDHLLESYQEGTLSFKDYFRRLLELIGERGEDLKQFKQISSQKEIFELEDQIRFPLLDQERSGLMNAVTGKLPPKTLSELLVQSLQFRMNRISSLKYHELLWRLAEEHRLSSGDFPNLKIYIRYIRKINEISEPLLFQELAQWIRNYQNQAIQTSEERRLADLSRRLDLIERLFKLRISNEDHRDYSEHRQDFTWDKLIPPLRELGVSKELDLFFPSEFKRLDDALPVFESFYETALRRDAVMLEKTLQRMEEKKCSFAILISGGFHTQGMAKALREKGISYRVLTPKVTIRNAQTPYFSLLLNEKNLVERWVEPVGTLTQAPLATSESPLAYPERLAMILRQASILYVGTQLMAFADPATGRIPVDRKKEVLEKAEPLLSMVQGRDFGIDFTHAFSPRSGILQVPVYKRNEKGEVVQAYVLMGRGAEGKEAMTGVQTTLALSERATDSLKSPQGDIFYTVVEQPVDEVANRKNESRDQTVISGLEALGLDTQTAEKLGPSLWDRLIFARRDPAQVQELLGAALGAAGKDLSQVAVPLLNALHQAAQNPVDFLIVAELSDSFLKAGLVKAKAVKEVENMSRAAMFEARAAVEAGKFLGYQFREEELKDEPTVLGVEFESIFEVKVDQNNTITARLASPEAARALKNYIAQARALGGRRGENYKLVFFTLTTGISREKMGELLLRTGIPEEWLVKNNLIIVEDVVAKVNEPRGILNPNPLNEAFVGKSPERARNITSALIDLVSERTKVDPRSVALVASDESILKNRLDEHLVVYVQREVRQMTSFDDAIRVAVEGMRFRREIGTIKDFEASDILVKDLAKRFGKKEEEIADKLRSFVIPPQPTTAEQYIEDIVNLEEEVIGQSA